MTDVMRVGLIGTGYWARTIHGLSAARHPGIELVGVWGRDKTKTTDAAAELGTRPYEQVEDLFENVDALTFAVPPDVQARIAPKAATFGKHLLLEKPVATSAADALAVERAVDQSGVASIVFFTRRFVPENQAWLQHVNNVGGWECGRGEFCASILTQGNPFGASPWRHEKGALWDVGPHALSVLLPVMGDVASVVAGSGLRDQVHLALQHVDGRSTTMSLTATAPAAAIGNTVYVYGEHGREVAPPGPFDPLQAHGKALDALIEQAAAPRKGHPCDVHFGARVVRILAAAEESLNTGRRVHIAQTAAAGAPTR